MDSREKLILQIMKECEADGEPVTREQAEEMAEWELKSKKDCRQYAKSIKPIEEKAERKPRTKKVDEEKKQIISIIAKALADNGFEPIITNEDKLIEVSGCTLNLVRHKAK